MVPLPHAAKLPAVKTVTALIRRVWFLICAGIRLHPCSRTTARIAFESEHRPAIFPCYRHEAHRSPHRHEVKHGYSPPFSRRCLQHSTLMNRGTAKFVITRLLYIEPITIIHE